MLSRKRMRDQLSKKIRCVLCRGGVARSVAITFKNQTRVAPRRQRCVIRCMESKGLAIFELTWFVIIEYSLRFKRNSERRTCLTNSIKVKIGVSRISYTTHCKENRMFFLKENIRLYTYQLLAILPMEMKRRSFHFLLDLYPKQSMTQS